MREGGAHGLGHRTNALMPCVVSSRASNAYASLIKSPGVILLDDLFARDFAEYA